jgi:hypothetical protein
VFAIFRSFAAMLAFVALCETQAFADDGKPDISDLVTGPITVKSEPFTSFVRDGPDHPLENVKFLGGLVLTSTSPFFGGWSGLLVNDDGRRFVALSDIGVWMTGELTYDGARPAGIANARLGPLRNEIGRVIAGTRDRDSESIALASGSFDNGEVLIGFEDRHRIERFGLSADGLSQSRGRVFLPPAAYKMNRNQGLEAMTVMKGGPFKGDIIALSERFYDPERHHTGWLRTGTDVPSWRTIHMANKGDFDLTDLSSLDDGTLFVLERRFRWLEGVKMRLVRVAPKDVTTDRTIDGETLIEADVKDNIDNMEGLAVTPAKSGGLLVTMISDDNFNPLLQRTLLLQFLIPAQSQATAR